jgi:Flp pilus assembly protein TadD
MTHSPVPDKPVENVAPGGGEASQLLQRADALVREGLGGAAIPLYRELLRRAPVQVDPHEPKAYHLIGRVLDRMGRPEEAREMYCRAKELVQT